MYHNRHLSVLFEGVCSDISRSRNNSGKFSRMFFRGIRDGRDMRDKVIVCSILFMEFLKIDFIRIRSNSINGKSTEFETICFWQFLTNGIFQKFP
jgi:hypothetical protein